MQNGTLKDDFIPLEDQSADARLYWLECHNLLGEGFRVNDSIRYTGPDGRVWAILFLDGAVQRFYPISSVGFFIRRDLACPLAQ